MYTVCNYHHSHSVVLHMFCLCIIIDNTKLIKETTIFKSRSHAVTIRLELFNSCYSVIGACGSDGLGWIQKWQTNHSLFSHDLCRRSLPSFAQTPTHTCIQNIVAAMLAWFTYNSNYRDRYGKQLLEPGCFLCSRMHAIPDPIFVILVWGSF